MESEKKNETAKKPSRFEEIEVDLAMLKKAHTKLANELTELSNNFNAMKNHFKKEGHAI